MTCTYGFSHFRHFQNCCNRDGNTIFKYMNYVSILVATDLEVHFSVLKKGVSQYFCLYSVCTSHWYLVMSFWLSWAVCLGSLSCWKVNLRPSLRSWALWRRFSSRISLYLAAFIFPSIATGRPVPAAEKHPHSMMLPPPCFTVGTVLDRWWAVPGFLHTYRLELRPKSSILVSSDQRILFVTILESFRCFLANSMRAFMCLALRRGFRRATLP